MLKNLNAKKFKSILFRVTTYKNNEDLYIRLRNERKKILSLSKYN